MNRINVLQFISPTGLYGAERWILALANNINTNKVKCNLAVTKESDKQHLDIIQLYPSGAGETFVLNMLGRFDFKVINKLCGTIRKHDIKIIHTHGYKSDLLGLFAAKLTGIKAISTPHGFGENNDFKLNLYIKLGTYFLKFFDKIVPLSRQLTDAVLQKGVTTAKVVYIQNGVDFSEIEYWRNLPSIKHPNRLKTIGYIGQMIPRKNLKDLLDTFDTIWHKHPLTRLVLIGDGCDRHSLEVYAKSLESNNHIHFLGYQDNRLEHLHSFDLFVMTSSYEGIPRCMMEAMAMGIPVTAYRIPGIDQLVIHEKTGLLSPVGDSDNLASNCEILLSDKPYADNIASAGRSHILAHYSAKRMADEYTALYETTLNE